MAHLKDIAITKDKIYQGGCHCRGVRFCLTGPLRQALICHCRNCFRLPVLAGALRPRFRMKALPLPPSKRLAGMTARPGPNADFAEIAALHYFIA